MGPQPSPAAEFDQLLRGHIPALFRQAYRWTGSVDAAEDLVQELLTRLFRELPRLRTLERLRPWAVRVMYRLFVDQLRRDRRSPVTYAGASGVTGITEDDEPAEAPDEGPEPWQLADDLITQERVAAAWSRLSEEHRVILSLHDIEGYSLEEAADMMGIPLGTAKSRLNRARGRLRRLLVEGTNPGRQACQPADGSDERQRG